MNYVSSVLRLRSDLWQCGIEHEFHLRAGDGLITRARNDCVAHFMAGNWTHLFFIDADIGFEPASAIRLLLSGKDVAVGVYPRKSEVLSFPIDLETVGVADDEGFAEVNEAATGFMCIARNVFEKMSSTGTDRHEFFDTMRNGDEYLSEDYAFCHRWRAIGGKVHIDMNCNLTHQGTKLYTGNIGDTLRNAR